MLAGNEREALLRVADLLCVEFGCPGDGEAPSVGSDLAREDGAMADVLGPEDEQLVASLRRGLTKLALALEGDRAAGSSKGAVAAALDGTEMVMRGELVMGNAEQLPALMPGFVFLVVLPVVDQDRALEISRRAADLVEEALG